MGKSTGFLDFPRQGLRKAPVDERIHHYLEFENPAPYEQLSAQGARCMNCGIPFCHSGCPLGNLIPDWNDHVYRGQWREAADALHATNNFPEFTGRICPAPCESSCVLAINTDPVTIKQLELSIVTRAWEEDWIVPEPPVIRTGKKVAVVGSGPAGLAAAQQLTRAGHAVTVFEKQDRPGGLLQYGIPNFKLDKKIIDRRIEQMTAEGTVFENNVNVGVTIPATELTNTFDAVCLTGGSEHPRDLPIQGRVFQGIHFAMEYLVQQNRRSAGLPLRTPVDISATDKHVIVIGGGDTGSDCVGTAHRQGAKSVTSLELMPQPPKVNGLSNPNWPNWPMIYRSSSSHEEGGERKFSILTKQFCGKDGNVTHLETVHVEWGEPDATGRVKMQEIPGSEMTIPADLVLLAMGFVHPVHTGLLEELGVEKDDRGNVGADTETYMTNILGVFAAGDMRRGQSLVVWAISEGREVAHHIDAYLMGESSLPLRSL
jgi:glutamate synthase (NADPH) small chain